MRVLTLTSCTRQKAEKSDAELTEVDFDDPARLAAREAELSELIRPAGQMYTGQQHIRAMRGIRNLRAALGDNAVDLAIISAGYGVVDETRPIAPYNVTFDGMSKDIIRKRGRRLGIPAATRALLPGHDIVFVLLGPTYLTALDPPLTATVDQRLLYLAKPSESRVTRDSLVIPAGTIETGRYGAGAAALKGRMLELIGAAVVRSGTEVLEQIKAAPSPVSVIALLEQEAQRS